MGNTFSYRLLYKVQKSKTRYKILILILIVETSGYCLPLPFFVRPIRYTFFFPFDPKPLGHFAAESNW